MALTEDQRAMLQLLLERGQTYEDISSLLGSDVDEIRSRARAALTDMGGADPDADVSLTDYLLGQADPIGRADAARHLQGDADARDLATKLEAQLRLIAPGADLPDIPSGGKTTPSRFAAAASTPAKAGKTPEAAAKPEAKAATASPASGAGPGLSGHQKRLFAALGAGALVILAVVLLAAGVFDSSDNSSDSTTPTTSDGGASQTASNTTGTTGPQAGDPKIVSAVLTPVGDADPDAKGGAVFGQLKGAPVLQIIAKGLKPTTDGENYSIWLYRAENASFRLSGVRVTKTGGIAAQIPVPRQVIQFISNGTFPQIDISLTKDSVLKAQAAKDKQSKKLTLNHLGDSVLRGTIQGPGVTSGTGTTGAGGGG